MSLLSRGRRYLNLSSPDVHWDQLNVLIYCSIKVTGRSIFKTESSISFSRGIQAEGDKILRILNFEVS